MIRDLAEESETPANCSVCVIGGGIAGLIAAYRLSASQRRVIVLESGGRRPNREFDPFNVIEQTTETYQNAVAGRVRALGGTSNAWGGRMMPLAPHDIGPRDYLGLSGWPIDMAELDRHVPEIERLFRLDQGPYESMPASPLVPDDPLRGGHEDMTARWSKWPTFRWRNIAHVLRETIANRANPTVWVNATVCGFIVDDAAGRLEGVNARSINGRRLTVAANSFILAAGTLETTRSCFCLTNRRTIARFPDARRWVDTSSTISRSRPGACCPSKASKPITSSAIILAERPGAPSTSRPQPRPSAKTRPPAGMSRSAPSSGPARSITMSAIWENRRRLAGCSSFCRTPRLPGISGASRPPSIGGCGTSRCTFLPPSTSSSTRGSSKSRTRFRASRSPIVATRLACRCCSWIGGGRPPTDELFARSCGGRASFGDRLLFRRRVLSPGPSKRTRTISSSGRWTPAIPPERPAWASTRARRSSIRASAVMRSRMSSSPAPPRFPRLAAPTRRLPSWRSRSGPPKARSPR